MKKFYIKIYIISIIILFIMSFIISADARVGGGNRYSGGRKSSGGGYKSSGGGYKSSGGGYKSSGGGYKSSGGGYHGGSYSGGGGSGGAESFSCVALLFGIGLIVIIAYLKQQENNNKNAITRNFVFNNYENNLSPNNPVKSKKNSLAEMIRYYKQKDPNFSKPLFLDFIQMLYTKVQIARGNKSWDSLMPYITGHVIISFNSSKETEQVDNIIIGSSNITRIDTHQGYDRIGVEFEANYTEHGNYNNRPQSVIYYVKENWILQRKQGVLSKGPEEISSFHCPSCGSPVELRANDTCKYCEKVVTGGNFHWQLCNVITCVKHPREPLQVGGGGIEEGTDLPHVFQPNFEAAKRAFLMRYPNFNPNEFSGKVKDTFLKLQHAWSTCNWEEVRPLETDYLFSMHKYWIEQYKAEGMKNCLEDIEILSMTTVKIEEDAFYEAITVRIKARMKDYTVNRSGSVIDGSKTVKRTFSEYWTFIRKSGFAGDTKEKKANSCPNCGADLHISMAGICDYCGGKITSGNFDWILSTIEQDEAYEG